MTNGLDKGRNVGVAETPYTPREGHSLALLFWHEYLIQGEHSDLSGPSTIAVDIHIQELNPFNAQK